MSLESSNCPLTGLWQPQLQLKHLYYGPSCVKRHLLDTLPSSSSKVFIITGTSIATKTPLVHQLETLLGSRHAGTFSGIRQHGPAADIDVATECVNRDPSVDTILSLGGGSPIDAAKTLSYRVKEKSGKFLTHLTIPTTLSAAECTAGGGYTKSDGVKVGFMAPEMGVTAIFYDPEYAGYTPKDLWLATGIRAMDHAVECFYHPYATEVPWKSLSIWAVGTLFECLPKARDSHPHDEDVTTRLLLAAFASSGLKGKNLKGGMGLSHSLGHALGSPYGIPHGITSCLTLGHVVKLKARKSQQDAKQIARLLPVIGAPASGDDLQDALQVGDSILRLVDSLGLRQGGLSERGVGRGEIPIIVQRATGGLKEGPMYDIVSQLVESLF
jgi:alcohol dehydrogenase class IV